MYENPKVKKCKRQERGSPPVCLLSPLLNFSKPEEERTFPTSTNITDLLSSAGGGRRRVGQSGHSGRDRHNRLRLRPQLPARPSAAPPRQEGSDRQGSSPDRQGYRRQEGVRRSLYHQERCCGRSEWAGQS